MRKILLTLLGTLLAAPAAFSDDPCGKCGAWVSFGGAQIVIGNYATQAEADAAAADTALQESTILGHLDSVASSSCAPVVCLGPPDFFACLGFSETRDLEWEVVQNGQLVLVEITGPDPAYRFCCTPDCPD